MPRTDLIIDLVKSASRGDQRSLKATVESIAAEERSKNHGIMADRLVQAMRAGFNDAARTPSVWDKSQRVPDPDLFFEIIPERTLDELFLPSSVRSITDELVEEHHRRDLLRSHGLEPRHKKQKPVDALAHDAITTWQEKFGIKESSRTQSGIRSEF